MTRLNWDRARQRDAARAEKDAHRHVRPDALPPDPDGYIRITTKYDTACSKCGKRLPIRSRILWHPKWHTVACGASCKMTEAPQTYASRRRST